MGRHKSLRAGQDQVPAHTHPLQGITVHDKEGHAVVPRPEILGIYFSAQWCPPCAVFTPRLGEKYKELRAQGKDIDVVFVSNDNDEESCNNYYSSMPWKLIPYADRAAKKKMMRLFVISSLPTLVLLDKEGHLISKDGENVIMNTPFDHINPQSKKWCVVS
jgi:thiol-disulfide isomerase/thioredoxin